MKKKVHLITSEWGKEKGGIQNWMYNIKKLLEKNSYDVDIFAYREKYLRKYPPFKENVLYILSTWKMLMFLFFHPIFLRKAKFIVFVHGNELLDNKYGFEKLLIYFSKFKNIKFVANSRAIADIFWEKTGRKIDFIQYPFIDFEEFNIYKDIPKKENEKPVFLTISRLMKRKNITNVLYALKNLKDEGYSFSYFIAGKGPEYERIKTLTDELGLKDEVFLLGRVSEEEKIKLLKQADYFLLPSIYDKKEGSIEGYGIVFIEANYFGIPVLSGNTGGMKEAVLNGITGFHCDATVEDIKSKIKKMLDHNWDRNKIISHALKHDINKQDKFLEFLERVQNE